MPRIVLEPLGTGARINDGAIRAEFAGLIEDELKTVRKYFDMIRPGFRNHRIFLTKDGPIRMRGGNMEVVFGAIRPIGGNRVLSYVNWGTGARLIFPRNVPQLRFRIGYRRATHPGSLTVTPPWRKFGNMVVFGVGEPVWNPGIDARRFDKLIAELSAADMPDRAGYYIKRIANKIWT